MTKSLDVYAIGNALVDTEYEVDDGFLRDQRIEKGQMTLVDADRLRHLSRALRELTPKRDAGGSAANTALAVRGFGGSTFYSCRIADDDDGAHFEASLRRVGVGLPSNARAPEGETGRCLVLITPDAERTMSTFLGVSERLDAQQLDYAQLRNSRFLYIEGYLSSSDSGREAAIAAREFAEREAVRTTLTLSDVSMVSFCRPHLERMLGNGVDTLFCNANEAMAWCHTDRIDIAAAELKDIARHLVITLGSQGALAQTGRHAVTVEGFPTKAIDTNGAGDLFAGAALWALSHGRSLEQAASFANFAAARLVTHFGARLPFGTYAELRDSYPGE